MINNETALGLFEKGIELKIVPLKYGIMLSLRKGDVSTEPLLISVTELKSSNLDLVDYSVSKLIGVIENVG